MREHSDGEVPQAARNRGLYASFIVEREQGESASVGKQMGFRKDKWAFRRTNGRYDSLVIIFVYVVSVSQCEWSSPYWE